MYRCAIDPDCPPFWTEPERDDHERDDHEEVLN